MIRFILILFFGFFLSANSAAAAELFFSPNQSAGIGQEFDVSVYLNTENELINALKTTIRYPENLTFLSWHDGNSVINVWTERLQIDGNVISFAGIIPGGYKGEKGLLLTLRFQGRQSGEGIISILPSEALLNDGQGTPTAVSSSEFRVMVSEEIKEESLVEKEDKFPPENFVPQLASDQSIFDGKWFLVFETQDKDSGVSHYEVREISQNSLFKFLVGWRKAESPYLLNDQSLKSIIEVKAIDNSGNERVISLGEESVYKSFISTLIIVLLLILGVWSWRFLRRRSS